MLERAIAEDVFAEAIAACDPAARVRSAIADLAPDLRAARRIGIAVGKAALAMARGVGPVARGLAIAPADDEGALPAGWRVRISAHPVPDGRSLAAAEAAFDLADREAHPGDVLLALISGGASSLIEAPRVPLDELRRIVDALMAAGAPITTLNLVRSALSRIKAGGMIARCDARVVTLAISDVTTDAIETIGSGPTIPRIEPLLPLARDALAHYGITSAAVDALVAAPPTQPRIGDIARVIAPMALFADAAVDALGRRGIATTRDADPVTGEVTAVAAALARRPGLVVAWGEPTLALPPDHGEGGRAQQLALELARHLRGSHRAALVVGSDGIDGPPPAHRPTPSGAFVDGTTWDAIVAAGHDPAAALARRDAGTVLAAAGALIVTGPTGINHADLVILG